MHKGRATMPAFVPNPKTISRPIAVHAPPFLPTPIPIVSPSRSSASSIPFSPNRKVDRRFRIGPILHLLTLSVCDIFEEKNN